jgi:hypothetical protein
MSLERISEYQGRANMEAGTQRLRRLRERHEAARERVRQAMPGLEMIEALAALEELREALERSVAIPMEGEHSPM